MIAEKLPLLEEIDEKEVQDLIIVLYKCKLRITGTKRWSCEPFSFCSKSR
ncbi:hypothetical protein [Metabacillus fastidiosus]|nr:hypothetical protein [Metabacillus fastidiosus]MEC2078702.1 hypothetical protein [Metabacillus fastidiosus]